MNDTTYLHKLIDLCTAIDHGAHGKMIKFFSTGPEGWVTEKAGPDHEADMRKADAALLHVITGDLLYTIRLMRGHEFKGPNTEPAFSMLEDCWEALGPKGCTGDAYRGIAPYSAEMIHLACGYLLLVLDQFDCSQVHNRPILKKTYALLKNLAKKAESKYEVISYQDTMGTL